MPPYRYKAKRGPEEFVSGVLEAENTHAALEKLSVEGLFPVKLEEDLKTQSRWAVFNRVPRKETGDFTRHMADLLESNIPLLRALELSKEQATNRAMTKLIDSVRDDVQGGTAFSAALGKFPRVFSPLYISLVHAGETGEMLPATLGRLADFMEKEEEFRSRLLGALAYPLFIAIVGSFTAVFLMLFVVPRLTAMFADTGQDMPWMARFLSASSEFMTSWGPVALVVCLASSGVWMLVRHPGLFQAWMAKAALHVPVWGTVLKKEMFARFSRTLAMLLAGGVPIVASMQVVAHCMDHPLFAKNVEVMAGHIEQGESLSRTISGSGLFPVFVCQMIAVGEETNTLEQALEKVAAAYDRETERAMKLAVSLLEPVMILGVGTVIGGIVIGMLLPIFQISAYVK